MRDIVKVAYLGCAVGENAWIRPDPALGETVENFQSVLIAAEALQSEGKIAIQKTHRESHTGHRLIDAILFMRLR